MFWFSTFRPPLYQSGILANKLSFQTGSFHAKNINCDVLEIESEYLFLRNVKFLQAEKLKAEKVR